MKKESNANALDSFFSYMKKESNANALDSFFI